MLKIFLKQWFVLLLIGIIVFSLCGCGSNRPYKESEMKFSLAGESNEKSTHITSSDPYTSIAGDKDHIVYIVNGNIVCYDYTTKMEKILVDASSSKEGYTSIVLAGKKAYYRELSREINTRIRSIGWILIPAEFKIWERSIRIVRSMWKMESSIRKRCYLLS
jgi:uncharacterized lipoprotein YehR (DUF1307 family)